MARIGVRNGREKKIEGFANPSEFEASWCGRVNEEVVGSRGGREVEGRGRRKKREEVISRIANLTVAI